MAGGVVSFALSSLKDPKAYLYLLGYLLFMFIPFINFFLVSWLGAVIILHAFQRLGFASPRLGFVKYVKLLLLDILNFFIALLSVYNPRWLMVLILVFILNFVFTVVVSFPPISYLLTAYLILYGLVVFHNAFRLWFSRFVFLSTDQGVVESSKTAWKVSRGRFWELFLGMLVLSIACFLVYLVLSAVIGFAVGAVAGVALASALNALVQASPFYAVLGVVPGLGAIVASMLVSFLVFALLSFLLTVMVLSGATKMYLHVFTEAREFGSLPDNDTPRAAWQDYKPQPKPPASPPSALSELSKLDTDLEPEQKPAKKTRPVAGQEETEEVQELSFEGLEEDEGKEA